MAITTGERLPEGQVLRMGSSGPETVSTRDVFAGRTVALFGVPGAYTGTCSTAHVPSFIRARPGLAAKGVDEVVCLSSNDPFVLQAWGEATGATEAGLAMLGDPSGDWIEALGQSFDVPHLGFLRRCRRFSALVEDGVVRSWHEEAGPGMCEATAGEALLAEMA